MSLSLFPHVRSFRMPVWFAGVRSPEAADAWRPSPLAAIAFAFAAVVAAETRAELMSSPQLTERASLTPERGGDAAAQYVRIDPLWFGTLILLPLTFEC
jgi:hypothetical protein